MGSEEPVRERIAQALVEEVAERGYGKTSVDSVSERAGTSIDEFREHFADLDDCLIRVYRERTEEMVDFLLAAFEQEDEWVDGLRAAAYATADFIHARPSILEFATTELFRSGLLAQARYDGQFQGLVDMFDAGRQAPGALEGLTRSTAEIALGAVYETVIRKTEAGEASEPEVYVPDLMYVTVRLYLGEETARRERETPPPPRYRASGQSQAAR